MGINYYSKRIIKLVAISLTLLIPIFEINTINKQIKAEKNLIAASEKDLFLYRQMGASYLCIASKAGIDFPKAIGVATATYVQVLEGKHGGLIKELGKTKLERKQLFAGAEFHIVSTAINYCPDSIPKDVSKKVNELINDGSKKNKNNKK